MGPLLRWLWRGGGKTSAAMSAGFGVFDDVFNPAAARARELVEEQNERVMPAPSPGDKLYDEKRIVIDVPGRPDGD